MPVFKLAKSPLGPEGVFFTQAGGRTPIIKMTEVLLAPLGVKKRVFVALAVFSLKMSTTAVLAVHFRLLNRKNITGDNMKNWFFLGKEKLPSHTHKTGSWYLSGLLWVVFKNTPPSLKYIQVKIFYCQNFQSREKKN